MSPFLLNAKQAFFEVSPNGVGSFRWAVSH